LYSISPDAREINKKWGQTRFFYGFVDQIAALSRWPDVNRGATVVLREAAMLELKTDKHPEAEYEQDLAVWYQRQADLLRERRFDQIDLENLIEELEVAGKNLHRELKSRLRVLIMHLLKCQFQHERISGSWRGTLSEQRDEIRDLIEENPSLSPGVMQVAAKVYAGAMQRAASETGLTESSFPAANPYSRDQLLDRHFIP
jgi:hypothetical protein